MKKIISTILLIGIVSVLQSQTKNAFLDRTFWRTNPTIKQVEQKIKEGHSATVLNPNGFDAVVYAILEKAPNTVIKHLLSKKGNHVDKLTHDKRTYIFWAAYKGNLEIVKHLINNKARLDLKDSHHFSPLTFAAVAGQTNTEIYDLFINNGIDIKNDVDEKGANALLLIIGHLKDFKLVNYFINKGLDLNSTDNQGNGAFNYTAYKGNKTMLELLIKKGLPYKNLSANGDNAILAATIGSRSGYNPLSFIKYLEGLGINPNVTNKDGITPLHNFAYNNRAIKAFKYFLNKGVNINTVDTKGNTPLINAARRNSLEVITLLSKKTTNINHTNKNGHSALTRSISNTPNVINFLLEEGANVNVVDKNGNNLSYYLIKNYSNNNSSVFDKKLALLTKKGLDIKNPQQNGNTLFHIALNKNNLSLLKKVHALKINVNTKNKEGYTPLHKAVMKAKNDTIIKYLLSIGANKNIKTDFNESVYELANENELLKQNNIDLSFLK